MSLNRREVLAAAGTAAAAGLVPSAAAAATSASGAPTSPQAEQRNVFPLSRTEPKVVTSGGTVTEATGANFDVLRGNRSAVFWLELQPGALREPHWHPNAWEVDVP